MGYRWDRGFTAVILVRDSSAKNLIFRALSLPLRRKHSTRHKNKRLVVHNITAHCVISRANPGVSGTAVIPRTPRIPRCHCHRATATPRGATPPPSTRTQLPPTRRQPPRHAAGAGTGPRRPTQWGEGAQGCSAGQLSCRYLPFWGCLGGVYG
jgi:hypothetical protein